MIKILIYVGVLTGISLNICAQLYPSDFISPLNIPLLLSGNYGELRGTHFHSGLDLKTQGVIGKPVFASCSGYVSRINIQSGAYGNSIYITHPNGYTTVYAHLDSYVPAIQKYVTDQQYSQKSFEIELFPGKDMFKFKQGELIGYSGNTGRSGGPHLHFEIRKTDNQVPLNGLLFKLPVSDQRVPEFRTLFLYEYTQNEPIVNAGELRTAYNVIKINDSSFNIKETVRINSPYFGFGTEVYDYLTGSANECGIYTLQLLVEKEPYFAFTIDAIPFDRARYVNAHMDYELKTRQNQSVHRLFVLPNNRLTIYNRNQGGGLMSMQDDSIHKAEIIATDAYGNRSKLTFSFYQVGFQNHAPHWSDSLNFVSWKGGAIYTSNRINIRIPPQALYEDIIFTYSVIPGAPGALSDTFSIFDPKEPLHDNILIEVPVTVDSIITPRKLMFGRIIDSKTIVAAGGDYINASLVTSTRSFGKYMIMCDTIAPVITPVEFSEGKKYLPQQEIEFKIIDEFSGLDSYSAYIDGNWALFKYDAKSGTLRYAIDDSRVTSGKEHTIKITTSDTRGNRSEFNSNFYY